MKKLNLLALTLIATAFAIPVYAGQDIALMVKMGACYRAHANLMDKPALKNARTCWRVHGYLMEKRS